MTDNPTTRLHDDHASASAAPFAPDARLTNGHPSQMGGEVEDDSTIKCICGYNDDDGNTVFCEDCNTWQHIECYYPYIDVPEVHQCIDCKPRAIDARSATERQRQARIGPVTGEKKAKRGLAKTQKKKTKDSISGLAQINGAVPTDLHYVEQPPAKRPKTNHRTSSSTTSITHPSARKRAGSTAIANRSPTKSPSIPTTNGQPAELYSPEFMRLYASDFTSTQTNSFSNLSVTSDLTQWLNSTQDLKQVTKGKIPHEVYQRWDKPWEELQAMSPGVSIRRLEDTSITVHGKHPVFQWLTAETDAPIRAFLGEVNGQIGRINDYCADPKNRWETLRHPEPFVFFHDKLPICIDARVEGSPIRYVRRSCQPNAGMEIVVVGQEYHFCLVAKEDIPEGNEITIGWNMDEKPQAIVHTLYQKKRLSVEDETYISAWISRVLANFGGCSCGQPESVCAFQRFRRLNFQPSEAAAQGLRPVPRKKVRKGANQISPLSTGRATNSRAGSEAVRGDAEEDIDSRSTSGSARSKPSSRDITPNGHYMDSSAGIGLGVELSSREQRKIQQQERLFEQMENDGSKRKKRNSAGSTLNTPSVFTSKQLGFPGSVDPSPTSGSSAGKARQNGFGTGDVSRKRRSPNPTMTPSRVSKPVYAEISTQTDVGADLMEVDSPLTARRRTQGCSFAMKLLRRTRQPRLNGQKSPTVNGTPNPVTPSPTTDAGSEMVIDSPTRDMPPPPLPLHGPEAVPTGTSTPVLPSVLEKEEQHDVEMKDLDMETPEPPPSIEAKDAPPTKVSSPTVAQPPTFEFSHPSIKPPALPRPVAEAAPAAPKSPPSISGLPKSPQPQSPSKSPSKPSLHVQLPPALNFATQRQTTSQTSTTPSLPSGLAVANLSPGIHSAVSPTVAQSPTASPATPLFSPSIATVVTPAPMKKKLSLSDYTNRKKKTNAAQQQAAQGSPLATATSADSDASLRDGVKEEKTEALLTAVATAAPSTVGPISSPTVADGEIAAEKTASLAPPAPENHIADPPLAAAAPTSLTAMDVDSMSQPPAGDVKAKTQSKWGAW